jgi:hypothetical protein
VPEVWPAPHSYHLTTIYSYTTYIYIPFQTTNMALCWVKKREYPHQSMAMAELRFSMRFVDDPKHHLRKG